MTVKELIDKLKGYEDFNIIATNFIEDGSSWGMVLNKYDINVGDIGHSDKIIHLDLTEI